MTAARIADRYLEPDQGHQVSPMIKTAALELHQQGFFMANLLDLN